MYSWPGVYGIPADCQISNSIYLQPDSLTDSIPAGCYRVYQETAQIGLLVGTQVCRYFPGRCYSSVIAQITSLDRAVS